MFKKALLFVLVLAAPVASASEQLKSVLQDIQVAAWNGRYEKLSPQDQATVTAQLLNVRDLLYGNKVATKKTYTCIKGANDGWQVAILPEGKLVGGETDYQSHCKQTLPPAGAKYACFFSENKEYALFSLESERFIGGGSEYYSHCQTSLPK